ncbi:MAG TPA: VWA domain-containing protein [Acidobacteriaceae bacterium]|jgi:VWFA-related protein|nr:VWA domain-containing protein [Acidobacteriaceae bacterium]
MPQRNKLFAIRILFVAALAFSCNFLIAQQMPATPAPQSTTGKPAAEAQPSLTVDRDPVASPDDTNQPANAAATGSGQVAPSKENGRYVFRTSVEEVVLNVTVVDGRDRMVTTLTEPDFTVFEDNVQQKISSFRLEDIPISLGILIDNSGSMREKRAAVNRAALDLVRASNPDDEAFIVNFSDDAFLDQDFTSSIEKLQSGLSHIDSRGGTALYDAVVASADHLAKAAKRPKQVLLIITDGEDNSSSTTLEETVRRIQDLQGPIVYSIGLLYGDEGGRESKRAKRALQLLSDETGGLAFFPKSLAQVDDIAAEVAKDIRNQYTIGYHSTKPESEGGYRTIRVVVKASGYGKLAARTRPGYFPTTQKAPSSGGLSHAPGANKPSH